MRVLIINQDSFLFWSVVEKYQWDKEYFATPSTPNLHHFCRNRRKSRKIAHFCICVSESALAAEIANYCF
jgi:hypothetical protein